MLHRSRVSRTPDVGRIGRALARPGMDPRTWVGLGTVDEVGTDTGEDGGWFVDVTLMPSGEQVSARVATLYAGNGWGLYAPLEVDDEVVVVLPNGEPDEGYVVIGRLWSAADRPPAEIGTVDAPSPDVLLRVKEGSNLKIAAAGAGNITIQTEGSGDVIIQATGDGKVKLGGKDGLEPAVLGTTLKDYLNALRTYINTQLTLPVSGATAGPIAAPPAPAVPTILAGEVEVK